MRMKKIDWKMLILTSLLCLAPIVAGVAYYDVLPENIAIHFDINNNPDNFWTKNAFVFGMPLMMLAIQLFTSIVVDLTDKRKDANKKVTLISKLMIPIITIILYLVTVGYALGKMLDIRKIAMWIVGIMFVVMGNYMPKTKGNSFVKGLNVKDDILQAKLNKTVGYMFIIDGLLAIGSTFLKPIFSVMVIFLLILETLILQIWLCKKLKEKGAISMKDKVRVIVSILVLIIIGVICFLTFRNIDHTETEDINYEVLSRSEYTAILEIGDKEKPTYEIIDADDTYYLIIYHGEEPTYFPELDVMNVEVNGKDIEVTVKLHGIGEGDAFSYPVAVLKLDAKPENIEIIRESGYNPEVIIIDSIKE